MCFLLCSWNSPGSSVCFLYYVTLLILLSFILHVTIFFGHCGSRRRILKTPPHLLAFLKFAFLQIDKQTLNENKNSSKFILQQLHMYLHNKSEQFMIKHNINTRQTQNNLSFSIAVTPALVVPVDQGREATSVVPQVCLPTR